MKRRYGPNGLHLFDRTTGWNILLDEVRPSSNLWSKAPAYVSIALTNACDLECAHCYAPKHRAILPFNDIIRWAKELDEHGCLGVGFGGGEPTLYPRFDELCEVLRHTTGLALSFTTHGHHLSQERVERLAQYCSFVRISMDGTGRVYEEIRGRSFEALLGAIRRVSAAIPMGINYVINAVTFPLLDEAVDIAQSVRAQQLLLLPEMKGHVLAISCELAERLAEWTRRNAERVPLAISENGAAGMDIPRLQLGDGGARFAHIDADATLKRCAFEKIGAPLGGNRSIISAAQMLRLSQ